MAQGWVWKAPKGLSVLNTNWQESPTVRATGRGNSPPQHPGWAAYVWMDIFRHCARFLCLYLYFTDGFNMAYFECLISNLKSICVPVDVCQLSSSGWESKLITPADIYSLSWVLVWLLLFVLAVSPHQISVIHATRDNSVLWKGWGGFLYKPCHFPPYLQWSLVVCLSF